MRDTALHYSREGAMTSRRSVRVTLRELANQRDSFWPHSAERCCHDLSAVCPNHEREIVLVTTAIRCEIVSEMQRLCRCLIPSILLPKLSRWLMRQTGMNSDEATWTVNSWAMALGTIPLVDEILPVGHVARDGAC